MVKIIFKGCQLAFMLMSAIVAYSEIPGYTIDGNIEGLKSKEKVFLCVVHHDYGRNGTKQDSAISENGQFFLSGFIPEGPQYYILTFEKHPDKVVRLFINNNEHIEIRSNNIENIKHDILDDYIDIQGSYTNFLFRNFMEVSSYYYQCSGVLNNEHMLKEIKDSIGFDPSLIGGVIMARKKLEESLYYLYFEKNKDNIDSLSMAHNSVIPFLIYMSGIYDRAHHPEILSTIYNSLSEEIKQSFYGKWLNDRLSLLIGKPFPLFSLPSEEGRIFNLKDHLDNCKLTLVHFWAVHSVERTGYQTELRSLYNKYKSKGLNIVGVSSDDSSSEYSYRKCLRENSFPWPTLCDFKGKSGIVETVYHEYGNDRIHNTTNVLINKKGDIVAWDPTGAELQWYLWKYLGEQ